MPGWGDGEIAFHARLGNANAAEIEMQTAASASPARPSEAGGPKRIKTKMRDRRKENRTRQQ